VHQPLEVLVVVARNNQLLVEDHPIVGLEDLVVELDLQQVRLQRAHNFLLGDRYLF